ATRQRSTGDPQAAGAFPGVRSDGPSEAVANRQTDGIGASGPTIPRPVPSVLSGSPRSRAQPGRPVPRWRDQHRALTPAEAARPAPRLPGTVRAGVEPELEQ